MILLDNLIIKIQIKCTQITSVCFSVFVFVFVSCVVLDTAKAAIISPRANTPDGIELYLEGKITQGDAERLEANFEHAKAVGLNVTTISLNSVGGNITPSASMARSIRARGLRTEVGKDAICASACFMLFAAGRERIANNDSRIGVHSAIMPQFGENESAKSATIDMARFLAELGVPSVVLGKMVMAKPSEMAWLTKEDLRSMRVNTISEKISPVSYVETATPSIYREALPSVVTPVDEKNAHNLLTKAQSQIRANLPQNAVISLKRAIELNPYDPLTASTYGYALHLIGRNEDARVALHLALQIKKDFAEAHRVLALTYASLGDGVAARDNFIAYYKKSMRADLAFAYLSDLEKSGQANSPAARAALIQLNLNR